jgi:hypothetical protein
MAAELEPVEPDDQDDEDIEAEIDALWEAVSRIAAAVGCDISDLVEDAG